MVSWSLGWCVRHPGIPLGRVRYNREKRRMKVVVPQFMTTHCPLKCLLDADAQRCVLHHWVGTLGCVVTVYASQFPVTFWVPKMTLWDEATVGFLRSIFSKPKHCLIYTSRDRLATMDPGAPGVTMDTEISGADAKMVIQKEVREAFLGRSRKQRQEIGYSLCLQRHGWLGVLPQVHNTSEWRNLLLFP